MDIFREVNLTSYYIIIEIVFNHYLYTFNDYYLLQDLVLYNYINIFDYTINVL